METTMIENNTVTLSGEIVLEKEFNHEVFGERFYMIMLGVTRKSGTVDNVPVMISDRYPVFEQLAEGTYISVTGQYRSYNRHDAVPKLVLSIFARDIFFIDKPGTTNEITLIGNFCKKPVFRTTPKGREICDILVAVNRPYGKSDYIPCITWGRNAIFAKESEVGDFVKISGRIQSREYKKTIGEKVEIRTAYEVSVSQIFIGE